DIAAHLLGGRCDTWSHRPLLVTDGCRVADHEYLRMIRDRKIRADQHAAGVIVLGTEPAGSGRGNDPRSPDDGAGIDASAIEVDAAPIAVDYARGGPHVDPHACERAPRGGGKGPGGGGGGAAAPAERKVGGERGESTRKKPWAGVGRAIPARPPAISTPVAPPPTMTKVSRRCRSASSRASSA